MYAILLIISFKKSHDLEFFEDDVFLLKLHLYNFYGSLLNKFLKNFPQYILHIAHLNHHKKLSIEHPDQGMLIISYRVQKIIYIFPRAFQTPNLELLYLLNKSLKKKNSFDIWGLRVFLNGARLSLTHNKNNNVGPFGDLAWNDPIDFLSPTLSKIRNTVLFDEFKNLKTLKSPFCYTESKTVNGLHIWFSIYTLFRIKITGLGVRSEGLFPLLASSATEIFISQTFPWLFWPEWTHQHCSQFLPFSEVLIVNML